METPIYVYIIKNRIKQKRGGRGVPWCPAVKIRCFHFQDPGSIPAQEAKIPQAMQHHPHKKNRIKPFKSSFFFKEGKVLFSNLLNRELISLSF